ncbi:MAG: helix-turn-helix transcriptional regulator [Acetobacteraceae bacterium]|nr:helix-turn-helix transcriptional regulator [Acetobacteraceae bacterium]
MPTHRDRLASAPPPVLRSTEAAWYARLGQAARAIGADGFHEQLLALFGSLIGHESSWIIRYSRHAAPEVLFTSGVPGHVLEIYQATYHEVDPFSRHWKAMRRRPGVITLRQVLAPGRESEIHVAMFLIKSRVVDEMAMFFPVIGHTGLALFLQRAEVPFSAADEAQAGLVFPALEGLHRAHMGRLFYELRNTAESEARVSITLPTLILDRAGTPAYTSRNWRDAERAEPAVRTAVEALKEKQAGPGPMPAVRISGETVLRAEVFDRDFPLAPGGRMLVLERRASAEDRLGQRLKASVEGVGKITRRERDILLLILRGRNTGEIAQALQISKGTIKNYRLRLYRKANVTSERALVSLLMPLLGRSPDL